jgi:hypothetical protein
MATRNTLAETIDAETAVQIPMSAREQRAAEETDDELSVVDRIRELIQGDAAEKIKIKLYRVNAKNGGFEWCRDLNAYEWQDGDLQMIRDEWGGGVFELRIYGRQGLMGKPRVRIADLPQQNPLALSAPTPEPQASSELASVLRMLAEGQNRLFATLSEKPDPMASMVQMGIAMKAMREAFGPSGDNGGKSSLDQVKELLAVTREVRSATKELTEDQPQPEPENMMGLASKLLGVIGPALTAQQQQPQQSIYTPVQPVAVPSSFAHAQPQQPLPTIEAALQPQQQQPAPDDEPLEVFELRQSIELLCKMAAAKQPAAKGGQLIYERMPDEMLDHMDSENWFDLVAQVFPIIRPHEAWLREAKAEADKLFAADENEPEQTKP